MSLADSVDNCVELSSFGLVNRVGQVLTDNRLVCRNFNNVKLVDFLKFLGLCLSSTRHTRKLFVKSEVVLERDCSKSFAFALNLYALFCLNRLMKSLVETSAVHKTTCKFVNDDNLAVLYNVVNVKLHNAVSLDSLIYVVLNCEVFGVCEVFYAEEFLGFLNAALCKSSGFLLFVNNVVDAVLLVVLLHILLGVKLGKTLNFESLCKSVCSFVEIG